MLKNQDGEVTDKEGAMAETKEYRFAVTGMT